MLTNAGAAEAVRISLPCLFLGNLVKAYGILKEDLIRVYDNALIERFKGQCKEIALLLKKMESEGIRTTNHESKNIQDLKRYHPNKPTGFRFDLMMVLSKIIEELNKKIESEVKLCEEDRKFLENIDMDHIDKITGKMKSGLSEKTVDRLLDPYNITRNDYAKILFLFENVIPYLALKEKRISGERLLFMVGEKTDCKDLFPEKERNRIVRQLASDMRYHRNFVGVVKMLGELEDQVGAANPFEADEVEEEDDDMLFHKNANLYLQDRVGVLSISILPDKNEYGMTMESIIESTRTKYNQYCAARKIAMNYNFETEGTLVAMLLRQLHDSEFIHRRFHDYIRSHEAV